MPFLVSLPNELLFAILSYLQRKELYPLRLVSKALAYAAGCALFANSTIYISDPSLPASGQTLLIYCPGFTECIKNVDLWVWDDSFSHAAAELLSRMPNLVGLAFGMPDGNDPAQALKGVFVALAGREAELRRLRLHVRFSFDSAPHGFVEDDSCAKVLGQVQDLHLHLEQYFDRWYNVQSLYKKYPNSFTRPCSTWLSPSFTNLRRLKLEFGSSCVTDAGYWPKLDFRKTFFERLEDMSISNLLICHDWFLEWLIKHGENIRRLALAFCPILRRRCLGQVLDEEGYILCHPESAPENTSHYERTYGVIFIILTNQFPKLRHFGLTWFAGSVIEGESGQTNHFMLKQGLYVSHSFSNPSIIPQSSIGSSEEDLLLARDEAALIHLVERIGHWNCAVEAVTKANMVLQNISTDESTDRSGSSDVQEDEWLEDSDGNLWTDKPFPLKYRH